MRTNTKVNKSALSWIANPNRVALGVALGGLALLLGVGLFAPNFMMEDPASAIEQTKNLPVNVGVDPVISITAPDDLTMDVSPTGEGSNIVKSSGTVLVSTNNVTGYQLLFSMASGAESTNLINTIDPQYHISNLTESVAADNEHFPVNSWGYSAEAPTAITTFNPLPALGSNIELINIDHVPDPDDPAETTANITTGTRVKTDIPAGIYFNRIQFTAITHEVPEP